MSFKNILIILFIAAVTIFIFKNKSGHTQDQTGISTYLNENIITNKQKYSEQLKTSEAKKTELKLHCSREFIHNEALYFFPEKPTHSIDNAYHDSARAAITFQSNLYPDLIAGNAINAKNILLKNPDVGDILSIYITKTNPDENELQELLTSRGKISYNDLHAMINFNQYQNSASYSIINEQTSPKLTDNQLANLLSLSIGNHQNKVLEALLEKYKAPTQLDLYALIPHPIDSSELVENIKTLEILLSANIPINSQSAINIAYIFHDVNLSQYFNKNQDSKKIVKFIKKINSACSKNEFHMSVKELIDEQFSSIEINKNNQQENNYRKTEEVTSGEINGNTPNTIIKEINTGDWKKVSTLLKENTLTEKHTSMIVDIAYSKNAPSDIYDQILNSGYLFNLDNLKLIALKGDIEHFKFAIKNFNGDFRNKSELTDFIKFADMTEQKKQIKEIFCYALLKNSPPPANNKQPLTCTEE